MMTYAGTKVTLPEVDMPVFTSGSGVGEINYTKGSGNFGLKKIEKIEVMGYDGYSAGSVWSAATDNGSVVTLQSGFVNCFSNATEQATVTYTTNGGETKTATVNVKMK